MRKLIMKMSMSLDGFICDANGGNEWMFKTGDPESMAWSADLVTQAGLIIMGRISYQKMAPYWPTATGPFASHMNEVPKIVFSKKLLADSNLKATGENTLTYNQARGITPDANATAAEMSWGNTRVFNGDLVENIKQLKAEPGGPIMALGGAGFMHSLIKTGLIDEYHLAIHPVTLGSGLSIFTGLTSPVYLKLVDVKRFPAGTVAHTYKHA